MCSPSCVILLPPPPALRLQSTNYAFVVGRAGRVVGWGIYKFTPPSLFSEPQRTVTRNCLNESDGVFEVNECRVQRDRTKVRLCQVELGKTQGKQVYPQFPAQDTLCTTRKQPWLPAYTVEVLKSVKCPTEQNHTGGQSVCLTQLGVQLAALTRDTVWRITVMIILSPSHTRRYCLSNKSDSAVNLLHAPDRVAGSSPGTPQWCWSQRRESRPPKHSTIDLFKWSSWERVKLEAFLRCWWRIVLLMAAESIAWQQKKDMRAAK